MGTYNFNDHVKISQSVIGDHATVNFGIETDYNQIASELQNLRDSLVDAGKTDPITLDTVDLAIKASREEDENKLKKHLLILKKYVGDFIKEFSITFVSDILVKTLMG